MKNKGFTLIELLAVIVILAIIALIATPIILGIINDARNEARQRSAEAVTHAVETAYLTAILANEAKGSTATVAVSDIIGKTQIENQASKDDTSITTTDGVKCTLSGTESAGFTLTCVDTKSNDATLKTTPLTGRATLGTN